MARRTEVNDFNLRRLKSEVEIMRLGVVRTVHDLRREEDVFGLKITVNETGLVQDGESIKELAGENLDELRTEATKLVLFDKLIKVG